VRDDIDEELARYEQALRIEPDNPSALDLLRRYCPSEVASTEEVHEFVLDIDVIRLRRSSWLAPLRDLYPVAFLSLSFSLPVRVRRRVWSRV
jgi:hypothetical protein